MVARNEFRSDLYYRLNVFPVSLPPDKSAQHRGICRVVSTHLPTVFGIFDLIGFERTNMAKGERETALVLTLGDLQDGAPLLHIHS